MISIEQGRRPILSIVGTGKNLDSNLENTAYIVGELAINAGFRIVTGGLGGVMQAASEGARAARGYMEGDVIGILPGSESSQANPFVDVAIPTGMGIARNTLVVSCADVVVAIGGGAGTLSEMALAWQLGKPVIALRHTPGWSAFLADQSLDTQQTHTVHGATDAEEAIRLARQMYTAQTTHEVSKESADGPTGEAS